ncbi:MAG: phosphatase PAP2 family protein [Chlorobi bacterium]|nr:phosphatase PAP2 family protein [Chlorobiota bacterium]
MKKMSLLFLLMTTLLQTEVLSQRGNFSAYSHKPDKEYFKSYLTVSKRLVSFPKRWNGKQWAASGAIIAGGVAIYAFDNEIRTFFQSNKSSSADLASRYFFEPWGSGVYPVALFGGIYIYGLASKDQQAQRLALGAAQAFVISGITVEILKHLTHRHRPYQDVPANPRLWEGPFKGFEHTSFPSGHTITVFSLASFVSSVYNDKPWVGILSYSIAGGVGLQRIYDDKHWASDVFIAAALGYGIGKAVYFVFNSNPNFSMGISGAGGLSLVYHIK